MKLDEVLRILASLERRGLEYAVVGGVAVNFHGIPRATEYLDLFVRPTPENIQRLRKALYDVFEDPDIEEISTDDLLGDYPAVRYYPPDGEIFVDILTRLGDLASFDDLDISEIEVKGVGVRLLTPKGLYRLKKGTIRDIDRADARFLKEKFGLEDDTE